MMGAMLFLIANGPGQMSLDAASPPNQPPWNRLPANAALEHLLIDCNRSSYGSSSRTSWTRCLVHYESGIGFTSKELSRSARSTPVQAVTRGLRWLKDHRNHFFGYCRIVNQTKVLMSRGREAQNPTEQRDSQLLETRKTLISDDIFFTHFDNPSLGGNVNHLAVCRSFSARRISGCSM